MNRTSEHKPITLDEFFGNPPGTTKRNPLQDENERKGYIALVQERDRLAEALRAIVDSEHCLSAYTVKGLRQLARAALEAK